MKFIAWVLSSHLGSFPGRLRKEAAPSFPRRFVWGSAGSTITTHPPAAPLRLREVFLRVQTPTPLQGLHALLCQGASLKWLPQWTWGFLGGGQSRHPKGQCWVAGPPMPGGHLVGQWAVVSFPGPLSTVLLISSINLSSHPFMGLNGGAPRSGGLDWKSLGHRRDPGGSGSGLPRDFVLVVG